MAQEQKPKEPTYILFTNEMRYGECDEHYKERLADMYKNKNWVMTRPTVDTIQFTCTVCKSVRVYKLKKEREFL